MAQKYTAKVANKERVSSKVWLVDFTLIDPPTIAFRAGQCVMLHIAPRVNRTMSIASPPSENTHILMAHDISPLGLGSRWTLERKVGDEVSFMAPTGAFFFDETSPRQKVFVATGTGIAPFHSMILDLFSSSNLSLITYHLSLYWGLRFEEDIFWKEEFAAFEAKYPQFRFHLILSKPSPGWQGLRGHVTEHVLNNEKDPRNTDFYLCGNQAMVEEMRAGLLEQNVPKEQIKTELFY